MNLDQLFSLYRPINYYLDQNFPQLKGSVRHLARLGKITEELGELNSAFHGQLKLHRQDKQAQHQQEFLETEWADVFNSLVLFGLSTKLDLPKIISNRLDTIYTRFNLPKSYLHPKPSFQVAVTATIYNSSGEILILKRSPHKRHAPGVWENISGGVESGEQPTVAILRESKEELGANFKVKLGPVYNTFHTIIDTGEPIIGICFLCKHLSGTLTLNHEHTDYQWVNLSKAAALTRSPGLKQEFTQLASQFPQIFLAQQ